VLAISIPSCLLFGVQVEGSGQYQDSLDIRLIIRRINVKSITILVGCGLAAGTIGSSTSAFAACGHDVHGSTTINVQRIGKGQ
jgi:hypothetical protein